MNCYFNIYSQSFQTSLSCPPVIPSYPSNIFGHHVYDISEAQTSRRVPELGKEMKSCTPATRTTFTTCEIVKELT